MRCAPPSLSVIGRRDEGADHQTSPPHSNRSSLQMYRSPVGVPDLTALLIGVRLRFHSTPDLGDFTRAPKICSRSLSYTIGARADNLAAERNQTSPITTPPASKPYNQTNELGPSSIYAASFQRDCIAP